ncbi:hypothetical protein MTR67_009133 [Solanum verrucosum]|uniref:non-specific serine/threonine protein kinase n=1 Tax=Solanum verrucosum TaxID=315347 RepID=A0AAF0Q3D0_SOLVR|nr:hypothetical protein MTR67_009133 [Solanum verrucosum]
MSALYDFSISSFLLILVLCFLVQTTEAQNYSRLLPQHESNLSHSWHIKKLKGQDLAGVLPPSLVKLPYLKTIDVSRNYLSGTIPPEWASIKLEYMSVMVNRLSGPIPNYLGNMTTLLYMSLENNMFDGTIPKELGNMVNLQNLTLSFNNLTGRLPKEINKLTKLLELRLSGNNFTGIFPSFENLKNLTALEILASGFEGPVPPSISVLTEMKELRISDLTGSASKFPPLENMTGLTKLMLRSCNLSGKIPSYIANMPQLKILDLSFNRLEGPIPDMERLEKLKNFVIDLSYNNFNESSVPTTCRETLYVFFPLIFVIGTPAVVISKLHFLLLIRNLFKSYNSTKKSELGKCLSSNDCSKNWYSVHINCGGESVTIGDTTYEADEDSAGAAKFVYLKESWGSSNTGDFWDRPIALNEYKATNVSSIKGSNSELYTAARLSALSLTYYGRCLANGNYTVTLHFAEIVIRDNRSFQSLGKRMFDIYVQGERELKDFDITTAAGGVDKPLTRKFNAVVEDGILEVRFQYAGKGTTAVPRRGSYGPLVSAISFEASNTTITLWFTY